jgi:hypothetical protein
LLLLLLLLLVVVQLEELMLRPLRPLKLTTNLQCSSAHVLV